MSKIRFTIGSFLGLFLDGIVWASPGAVLPQWTTEFRAYLATGLFFNLFLLGSLVGINLASRLRHRHPLMFLALGAMGIAFLTAAKSLHFEGVLGAAVLMGLGDGILIVHANSLVGELHAKRRVAMLNWVNAAFGLGALGTPLLAAFLHWRTTFTLVALLAFLAIVLVWKAPPVQNFAPVSGKMLWRDASIPLVMIMLFTGLEGALGTWSSTYLVHLGWDVTLSGTLLSLYWSGLLLGQILLGSLVAQNPLKYLTLLLFGSLAVLMLNLIPTLATLFPLAAFFYGPLHATLFALLQERCGHVAVGYLFYAAIIGKAVIPAAFSLLENPAYLPYGFIFLALLLYLLSFLLRKKQETA